jgi:4,5-DOPA dioxygenase extradiol
MYEGVDLDVASTESSSIMPIIFVGHGLAINAVLHNDFATALHELTVSFPPPQAIAVMSAHWVTPEIHVTGASHPHQIFDSIEFQQELLEISYKPPGEPALAEDIRNLLRTQHIPAKTDPTRGLDGGVWGILVHMYPVANIPVVEISLSYHVDASKIVEVGKALAPLRRRGVLLMGSGGLVHNMYEMNKGINTTPPPWAIEADKKIAALIQAGNASALSEFVKQNLGRSAAIPTPEHILPAIAMLALKDPEDHVRFFYESFQNSTLSMRSFIIERRES